MVFKKIIRSLPLVFLVLLPVNAEADTAGGIDMDKIGDVLITFLILAVIFEVALTPIFNWRIFAERFEGKGVKTPLIVVLAFIIFWKYDLDIITDVLVALDKLPVGTSATFGGQLITALLIAGGSDGVFRVFTRLGIRNPQERVDKLNQRQCTENPAVP